MWSNFRLRSMIRAAVLSTFCRGWTLAVLTTVEDSYERLLFENRRFAPMGVG